MTAVATVTNVDDLAARFVTGTLPQAEWTHVAHLMVGAWHVHHYGADEVLVRMRAGIRRLNDAHGTPNSPTSGYHETVTRAYVRLLAEFLAACPAAMSLDERVDPLITGPFAAKDLLLQFYSRDRLMASSARAEWVEPDVAPLRLPDPDRRAVLARGIARVTAIALAPATLPAEYESARALFQEYAAWLGVDLCFQGFTAELDQLPEMYAPPSGCLILGRAESAVVACVGVRRFSHDTCEMKRLFVRESARGGGVGRRLAMQAVEVGRRLGYERMVLDTLDSMSAAQQVYASLGFREIPAYYPNPLPGVRYFALDLTGG